MARLQWESGIERRVREHASRSCGIGDMSEEGELDRALAERALAGEPAAQEEFASRMECMLHYLAWLNSKRGSPLRPDELMDLNGVVQLLVWKKLPKFEGRSRLETWALGFCRFEFLRALRERRKRARESETVDEREFETVSDDPVHPEAELAPYMKHLSPMQ